MSICLANYTMRRNLAVHRRVEHRKFCSGLDKRMDQQDFDRRCDYYRRVAEVALAYGLSLDLFYDKGPQVKSMYPFIKDNGAIGIFTDDRKRVRLLTPNGVVEDSYYFNQELKLNCKKFPLLKVSKESHQVKFQDQVMRIYSIERNSLGKEMPKVVIVNEIESCREWLKMRDRIFEGLL